MGTKVLSRLCFIPGFLGSRQTFCFFWIFGSITNIEASAAASGLTGFASSTRHLQPKTHHTRAHTRASSPALPLTPASCHPRAPDTPARARKTLPGCAKPITPRGVPRPARRSPVPPLPAWPPQRRPLLRCPAGTSPQAAHQCRAGGDLAPHAVACCGSSYMRLARPSRGAAGCNATLAPRAQRAGHALCRRTS